MADVMPKMEHMRPSLNRLARPVAILAFVISAAVALPGSAVQGTVTIATPMAKDVGYATRVMVLPSSTTLSFLNLDTDYHNVVSKAMKRVRIRGRIVIKPLFASALTGLGKINPVIGTADLKPGTYAFYCGLHPSMTGSLIVR
jgi:plastocyanin